MGFLEALTLVLVVLKLTAVIDWSWVLVFSPMLGAVALYISMICLWIAVKACSR